MFVKVGDLLPGCAEASKQEKECVWKEGDFTSNTGRDHPVMGMSRTELFGWHC